VAWIGFFDDRSASTMKLTLLSGATPMLNRLPSLPTEFDLPDTDNQPVDNELQILVPYLLRAMLLLAWEERFDWFMGINLGVYYALETAAIGPDAFLSLGVPRFREDGTLRLSYVVWHENNVMPLWALEIVSKKPGGEYDEKFAIYQEMGVLYYVIFNPEYSKRERHDSFEVYRLEQGRYVRQLGNPIWMPEIGLGIGMEMGIYEGGVPRQWLYWYDKQGQKLPVPENVIVMERQRAEQERLRAEREQVKAEQERIRAEQAEQQIQDLMERLRSRGIDPEQL
jgi:Uma2 family endonuclease